MNRILKLPGKGKCPKNSKEVFQRNIIRESAVW